MRVPRSTSVSVPDTRPGEPPGADRNRAYAQAFSDRLMPADVITMNLATVADALEAWMVPYWLVRDDGHRHRIAIPVESRGTVLRALAGVDDDALHAEVFTPAGKACGTVPVADLPDHAAARVSPWLRAFRRIATPSAHLVYGPMFGVDVEFWTIAAAVMTAPRPTAIGAVAHTDTPIATTTVAGRPYPTLEPFLRNLPNDITFPIDAVYVWVDGSDPAWQARLADALAAQSRTPDAAARDPARFRDRGELRYSLRSIEMYAPWFRHIWIVSDAQTPQWLDLDHPRVSVVDHRAIAGERAVLPTFNSRAIATMLHRIDGLSEHFVVFNDDFFLGRPVPPSRFFEASGAAKFFVSSVAVPFTPAGDDEPFSRSAARNNRELLRREFAWTPTHLIKHAPYAVRRSVLAEVHERFPDAADRTARSQFRSRTDIEPVTLSHYYGYLTGRGVRGSIDNAYANTCDTDHRTLMDQLLAGRRSDCFCLNDAPAGSVPDDVQQASVAAFLRDYFPIPARFERPEPSAPIPPATRRRPNEETATDVPITSTPAPTETDALLFEWLIDSAVTAAPGDLLEMGPFNVGSAIHMARFLHPTERLTVVGTSDDIGPSVRPEMRARFVELARAVFESNYHAEHGCLPRVLTTTEHLPRSSLRFVHLVGPGRHDDVPMLRGLCQADAILAIDERSVADGLDPLIHNGLNVICTSANKVYATWGDSSSIADRITRLMSERGEDRITTRRGRLHVLSPAEARSRAEGSTETARPRLAAGLAAIARTFRNPLR
jgi:hypothetical protein